MNKNITFYPTLDVDQLKLLNKRIIYNFHYFNDENRINISSTIESDKYMSLDSKSDFDKEENSLFVDVLVSLNNQDSLFGSTGIAPTNSQILLVLECYSQKSKFRKVLSSNKYIDQNNLFNDFSFELEIEPNTIDKEVNFSLLLILSKPADTIKDNELFLNNQPGVIIGTLDKKTLYLSGNGSLFPVYTKYSEDKKLWDIKIDYEDPTIDKFSETVQLILNSSHKDYDLLNPQSKNYCERLIYEIISSAVTLIILDLKEKNLLSSLKDNYLEGTIMHFIKYCNDVIHIDLNDTLSISSTIRAYLNGDD